jgi:class 3 adenylate cyclase
VTVLFADVKGSMELAERVDPEEWHRILDRFFQILSDRVHRFEGTVNQYTGDGIMALFGATIAHEDHAQRACYAALALRAELRAYATELRIGRGLDFSVRMGLNSGEVIVGKIGDDLRMDYTAQGHTVGLAERMEKLAESGAAYLSQHTARRVEGYFELRDLGESPIKGADAPVGVFELEGVGPHRTRLDVSRSRGLSKFVGRDDEMATLHAALERMREGHGQVLGVVAEAGAGKSRLCFEFIEHCRLQTAAVVGKEFTEPLEQARASAVALVEKTGARAHEPFVHELDAECARRRGDSATQQQQLREAQRLFDEMGATGHAARLARELEGLGA